MHQSHNRYRFSRIDTRPVYDWPNGTRLAVYIAVNIEHFRFGEFPGSDFTAVSKPPFHRGYAWRDYGNRVGVWRILDLLNEYELPACINLNSIVYDHCPEVVAAFRERGDEIVAHGRTNSERQAEMTEDEERAMIAEVTERIRKEEGRRPRGWLGPWISQSLVTPDLLQEAGYDYMMDWPVDDQPIWFSTRSGGKILNIPYPSMEVNDSPAFIYRRVSEETFTKMIIDDVEEKLYWSQRQPLVCPIALHTFIVGQPFRLRELRKALEHIAKRRNDVWLTRPGEICDHILSLPAEKFAY